MKTIETKRESFQRCDYIVYVEGDKIYIWCERNGYIKSHYAGSSIKPPEYLENKAIEILRKHKQGDKFFDATFGNPEDIYI
jgi:hypothetical protein